MAYCFPRTVNRWVANLVIQIFFSMLVEETQATMLTWEAMRLNKAKTQECAHVCEAEEDNVFNDGCRETEQSHDKFVGSNVEALRNIKRMWVRLLDIFCFGLREETLNL